MCLSSNFFFQLIRTTFIFWPPMLLIEFNSISNMGCYYSRRASARDYTVIIIRVLYEYFLQKYWNIALSKLSTQVPLAQFLKKLIITTILVNILICFSGVSLIIDFTKQLTKTNEWHSSKKQTASETDCSIKHLSLIYNK